MKFGGTSVQDAAAIQRTIDVVKGRRDRQQRPIVVVSALAGVTDELLSAANKAVGSELDSAIELTKALRTRHLGIASQLVGRKIVSVIHHLDELFDGLDVVLRGVAAVGELTLRTTDLVASFGERLSSLIVAEAFEHRGLSSALVDARTCIVTDEHFGKATPQPELIADRVREHILPLVEANAIPILGGFIAASRRNIPTTLGRGGSDYTAALVGRALQANAIEIWTDVNGIMTTDPRICGNAMRLKRVSFEEASELAYFGAKVLHPATILPAVETNIPVWVLNSHNPANEGTVITAAAVRSSSPIKSIAVKKHLLVMHILSRRLLVSHGFLRAVFDVLDRYSCVPNMLSNSEVSLSMVVERTEELIQVQEELARIADVSIEEGKALICLVGDLRQHRGVAARALACIRTLHLEMISQGANRISMNLLVNESETVAAVQSLHTEFFTDLDESIFDTSRR